MRAALLIGTGRYDAPKLPRIKSASHDVNELAQTLRAPGPGAFEKVDVLVDRPKAEIELGIETLLTRARSTDLVLLYFSCHGEKSPDGLLHFLTRQTRPELLSSTAVAATFIHRQLEESRAGSKVLLLDCCFSGAFAAGFSTKAAGTADVEQARGRGTYVITASNEIEYAYAPQEQNGGRGTSLFTGLVIEGLRGAAPGAGGWIGCDELFDYITEEMRGRASQTPTRFATKVQGTIHLARRGSAVRTGADTQAPAAPAPLATGAPAGVGAEREADDVDRPLDAAMWPLLMDYFQRCIAREAILGALVPIDDRARFGSWPGGPEPLLANDRPVVALPESLRQVASREVKDDEQLRFGYPVVLVEPEMRNGRPSGSWRAAPLLVADCAVERSGPRLVLRRTGPVTLNRQLVSLLGSFDESELDALAAEWESETTFSDLDQLGAATRGMLDDLGIPSTGTIEPGSLAAAVAGPPFRRGAQNLAMLYLADAATSASAELLKDLRNELATNADAIPATALGSLLTFRPVSGAGPAATYDLVAPYPLNEAQEKVIAAAMSGRLTVATGPPGTGKSQLITGLVATAVASGQSVLMASTNNGAVEVVVQRANALVPGRALIVRTGNKEKRAHVPETLREMLARPRQHIDVATPRSRLRAVAARIRGERLQLDGRAEVERQLESLAAKRHRWASGLGWQTGRLPSPLRSDLGLRLWSLQLRSAAWLGPLGGSYRSWIAGRLDVAPDHSTLATVSNLIRAELGWRLWRSRESALPDADDAAHRLREAEEAYRKESGDYLQANLMQRHAQGRNAIERCSDEWDRKTWGRQFADVLPYVPAWATTTLSTRHLWPRAGLFDLAVIDEASQCSIPQVLPVLYRAKRAVIIGDPNQLTHVTRLSSEDEESCRAGAGLSAAWLDRRALSYCERSAFDAFARAADRPLLLDEHYRSHPTIVEVPNRCYYAGQLVVLTDPTALACRDAHPVRWKDVAGRAEHPGSSCRNGDEAEAVVGIVRQLDATLPSTTSVGVVTPFKAQRVALDRAFRNAGIGRKVEIGTIHTFQGRECDVMVLSPVGASGIRPGTLTWLRGQTNLWNVAITRARSMLCVVGDRRFWEGQGSVYALRELALAADGFPRSTNPSALTDDPLDHLGRALMASGAGYRVDAELDGYPCDVLLDEAGDRVALLVDSLVGRPDPGRRLRQALRQRDLLVKAGATRAMRAPAWRCISEPEEVVAEARGRAG